jgi:DNA-binding IclR family transcriptional regulator
MYFMSTKISARTESVPDEIPSWTFLSNHAHVLICIAKDPEIRLSEIAELVGIRERTVHRIVHELSADGYLSVFKDGRKNTYEINLNRPLRHPLEASHNIQVIIEPLLKKIRSRA